jgi:prevent-host-death family protein
MRPHLTSQCRHLDVRRDYVLHVLHLLRLKTVSARRANHHFSKLLSRVERGEEILITKRSKPVALLSPYQPLRLTPERKRPSVMQSRSWHKVYPGVRRCEISRATKCTSDDDQL